MRERNRVVFEGKSRGKSTRGICESLDAKGIPIVKAWKTSGLERWTQAYDKNPRRVIRLFSVIYIWLGKFADRERAYYFEWNVPAKATLTPKSGERAA